jgi:hypothetical protein
VAAESPFNTFTYRHGFIAQKIIITIAIIISFVRNSNPAAI